LVLEALAARHGLSFRGGRQAEEARAFALGVTLLKPRTFMNLSGAAVQAYSGKLGAKPETILVVHDDLDLPLGRLRFRSGGGAGGQGGVKDIIARIGPNFHRLKVGIGRPPPAWTVEGWVLSRFKPEEEALLGEVIEAAVGAIGLALGEGLSLAMNRTNGLDLRPAPAAEPATVLEPER
jgi:PTH1 family peptidyl-tRNA hydrolase